MSFRTRSYKRIHTSDSITNKDQTMSIRPRNYKRIYTSNSNTNKDNKKGVHCSFIRCTAAKSERSINLQSGESTINCKWRRSTDRDLNDFSPIYAANNANTRLLRIKKRGLKRVGKKQAIIKDYDDDDRNEDVEHNEKIPLMTQNYHGDDNNDDDDDDDDERDDKLALTNIIKQRKKALPLNNGYFNNIHNFVNRERVKRDILPLNRARQLDELASEQAKIMAAQQSRDHSDLDTLMSNLIKSAPCRRVGENVCRGTSVKLIHKKMMRGPKYAADKNNILDRRYSSFGIGTAPCVDGIVYVCQIYKG